MSGAKTITPSRFHVPPRPFGALQSVCGGPPAASIFLSLPFAKNPMKPLSGDQKGKDAHSVPASGCAEDAPSGRSQRDCTPLAPMATTASRSPSGDTAMLLKYSRCAFSGGGIIARTTFGRDAGALRKYRKTKGSAAISASAKSAATIHGNCFLIRSRDDSEVIAAIVWWEAPEAPEIASNANARSLAE